MYSHEELQEWLLLLGEAREGRAVFYLANTSEVACCVGGQLSGLIFKETLSGVRLIKKGS